MLTDGYGLIVSKTWAGNLDGGDTLAETGRIYFLKKLCNMNRDGLIPFHQAIERLRTPTFEFIRSPHQWNDPKDVSRDQMDPMIMCMSMYGDTTPDPKFRYPNGDLASPEHMSHHYRSIYVGPFVYLADLFMLLNTLIICFITSWFKSQVKNDLNHIISLCFAEYYGPTFISRMAAWIYLKCRNYNWALSCYYHPDSGNNDLIKYYLAGLNWLDGKTRKP